LLQVLNVEQVSRIDVKLTAEGQDMLNNGSYEYNLYKAIPADGILHTELMVLDI